MGRVEDLLFDIGMGEAAVLGVLALVIFGDKLPQVAQQAGRTIRQLRQMADSAKSDLREGLGPEFADFDPADLNPKRFVAKHLFEGESDPLGLNGLSVPEQGSAPEPFKAPELPYGERPPFDLEAT